MENQKCSTNTEEDFTLRVWDSDESVLGELLISLGIPIQTAIERKYSGLSEADAEDVVAEAFCRFWKSREHFDGSQSLGAYLYRIAENVAIDFVTGHLVWQKTRLLEKPIDDDWLRNISQYDDALNKELDSIEGKNEGIYNAIRSALEKLTPVEQAVIKAYAYALDGEVKSGPLGIELGNKLCDGVPIPAGTIRQHKLRAKEKMVNEMQKLGDDHLLTGGQS